jgi:glyoxylase I family protein
MIEHLGIAHASVLVADTQRALGFYRDVLGMRVLPERPDLGYPGAWLAVGEQQIHLLELPYPDPVTGRPAHGGRDRHMAIDVHDMAALKAALDSAGVSYTASRSGRAALFCRDPDGNGIEIIEHGGRGESAADT